MKKIFDDEVDESVHSQFQKFSRGEFKGRAMVRVKNSSGRFSVSTGPEYAKDLIMAFAEKLGDGRTMVTGALISALDLDGFEYKEKKSAIGVRKYIIESEMSGNEILDLCEKVDKAFFGLSFKVGEDNLKIKMKSSKGASSSKKEGEKVKIDFCKFKTSDKSIVNELIFGVSEFKNVEISHDYIIEDIVVSDELKASCGNDFALIRGKALRKGRVIRRTNVDGREIVREKEFEV